MHEELTYLLKNRCEPNEDYDPRPAAPLMKKVNFYFDAYNKETSLAKHMRFSDNKCAGSGMAWKSLYDLVFTMDKDRRDGIMQILEKYDEPVPIVKKT